MFVIGGILGNDPPEKRTYKIYYDYKYNNRNLGKLQMTVDTAFNVVRKITLDKNNNINNINDIKFKFNPELIINENENVNMPYNYILNDENKPIFNHMLIPLINQPFD